MPSFCGSGLPERGPESETGTTGSAGGLGDRVAQVGADVVPDGVGGVGELCSDSVDLLLGAVDEDDRDRA
jgi:hypothetical protein